MLNRLFQGAAIMAALFLFAGCVASKKNHANRLILQGIDTIKQTQTSFPEPKIQKGDLLTVLVFSDNAEVTAIFNQPQDGSGGGAAGGASNMSLLGKGYRVDADGMIYFHKIGKIKADGLTRKELEDFISTNLKTYLQNPYVTVRFTNSRITVLGEVLRPGVIELPDQKVSVLDAIGFAGDMTPFGRRDNVLVVREKDGVRVVGRIDLRNANLYQSPYFYLQQNDMVYIEPNRKKPTGNEQVLMRNITIASSLLSVVTLIITLIK